MANDCENVLELEHSDETKIDEAIAAYKRGDLLAYFDTSWGRRDIYGHANLDAPVKSDNSVELNFWTAWGPPVEAYDAAVARHGFKLVAYYNEIGCQFCGEYVPNEKHVYVDYEKGSEIPSHIDDIFEITKTVTELGEASEGLCELFLYSLE